MGIMRETASRPPRIGRPARWPAAFLISLAWLVVIALAVTRMRQDDRLLVALAGFGAVAITFLIESRAEKARWRDALKDLTQFVQASRQGRRGRRSARSAPPGSELVELTKEVDALGKALRDSTQTALPSSSPATQSSAAPESPAAESALTKSGLHDAPAASQRVDPHASGDYSTIDMVNRLEPAGLVWIESSPAEQEFLGWSIAELRQKSFIDILLPEDRDRARATFKQALDRGEALGLVVRLRTAQGKARAVEVNVGARYGTNQRVSHLRCHITDVTDKVRADRELRLRTLELTQVNEQLRKINRELVELKDRYTDLYENAPAMYFSLDLEARFVEINQTMLAALSLERALVLGQPYPSILHESQREGFDARFQELLAKGFFERETRWVTAEENTIDVWVRGKAVSGSKGSIAHTRFVAQDVTAKHRLEAELEDKNERLAQAVHELSNRNRELDEFVYVVSHDLQEPLRTLTAFSDFLLQDCGEKIGAQGQEYVRYLVDASRRMRSMIQDLLTLSRAARVTAEFASVDLEELLAVVKTDLAELFRSKSGELRINRPLPLVWGDRNRIAQLLVNLISNGIKYNRSPTPWVEIEAIEDAGDAGPETDPDAGNGVTISVKDNGIGIDRQFHSTIFQLFRRLHAQEEYEGTGAGLSICSKIVQAHGGRIWVESEPGCGATFFVRLKGVPAQDSAAPSPSPVAATAPSAYEPEVSQVRTDERHAI
jgi:PAS domain S-box-containing protein